MNASVCTYVCVYARACACVRACVCVGGGGGGAASVHALVQMIDLFSSV